MSKKVYLLYCIDARDAADPPTIIGAAIIGEDALTATLRWRDGISYCNAYEIAYGTHPGPKDFDSACEEMLKLIDDLKLGWVKKFLDDETFDAF